MYNKTDLAKIKRTNLTERQCKNIIENIEEFTRRSAIDKEIYSIAKSKLEAINKVNKIKQSEAVEIDRNVVTMLNAYYNMLNTLRWQIKKLKSMYKVNYKKVEIKENRISKINSIIDSIVNKYNISSKDCYYIKVAGMSFKEVLISLKHGYNIDTLVNSNSINIYHKL